MSYLRGLFWLAVLLAAGPAHAHAPIPGIKGFYTGLLHPFSTPSQALVMLGLGLLVGSFAVERVWPLLAGFLVVSLMGLFWGAFLQELDPLLYAVAVTACALAALVPGILRPLALVVTAGGAFLIGAASIPDAGPASDRVITMAGSLAGANIGLLYLFGFRDFLRRRYDLAWVGIAFRIAAAWLGAISLVMLALGYAASGATA